MRRATVIGKYDEHGKPRAFPAHNIVFVVTGTFILLFGWMGFNPGSTLGATDLRISVVAVNTNLAAAAGVLAQEAQDQEDGADDPEDRAARAAEVGIPVDRDAGPRPGLRSSRCGMRLSVSIVRLKRQRIAQSFQRLI